MFTGEYWWVALIQLIFFTCISILLILLKRKPDIGGIVARVIAFFLLAYKIGEYTYWQCVGEHLKIPLEFSALSYFIYSIIIGFDIKKGKPFAVLVALLTGVLYNVSLIISPDSFVITRDSVFLLIMAMINHTLLYLGSMLTLLGAKEKYDIRKLWTCFVGLLCMVGYAWLLYSTTNYAELYDTPIIIQLSNGTILSWLNPEMELPIVVKVISIILEVIIVTFAFIGVYSLNNILYKKRIERELQEPKDEEPSLAPSTNL